MLSMVSVRYVHAPFQYNRFSVPLLLLRQDPDTKETQRFVTNFDQFFDMLNTRCFEEGIHRRKPDLAPYYNSEDSRLKVSFTQNYNNQ